MVALKLKLALPLVEQYTQCFTNTTLIDVPMHKGVSTMYPLNDCSMLLGSCVKHKDLSGAQWMCPASAL